MRAIYARTRERERERERECVRVFVCGKYGVGHTRIHTRTQTHTRNTQTHTQCCRGELFRFARRGLMNIMRESDAEVYVPGTHALEEYSCS
jgi:hypothetical protein